MSNKETESSHKLFMATALAETLCFMTKLVQQYRTFEKRKLPESGLIFMICIGVLKNVVKANYKPNEYKQTCESFSKCLLATLEEGEEDGNN